MFFIYSETLKNVSPTIIILIVYAVVSLATFIAFALDKSAAVANRRRWPEQTLHALEFFGGWPGALLAIFFIRHKNRKFSYLAVLGIIILIHVVGWVYFKSR